MRGLLALALCVVVPGAAAAESSCAGQPSLVGPCVAVRGRATLWNGTPSVRIWKVGTRRVLGVSEGRCQEPSCRRMPAGVAARLDWEHAVFADFVVCPFTPSRPGHMQFVCVESASRIEVRPR